MPASPTVASRPVLAMEKVEGSSPFIRLSEKPRKRGSLPLIRPTGRDVASLPASRIDQTDKEPFAGEDGPFWARMRESRDEPA